MSTLLIVIGGRPGTGKTSLARGVARALDAVHLRIDTIEQALRSATMVSAALGTAAGSSPAARIFRGSCSRPGTRSRLARMSGGTAIIW
jgi:cytidylate kinase